MSNIQDIIHQKELDIEEALGDFSECSGSEE
jgi:hypothetical protein